MNPTVGAYLQAYKQPKAVIETVSSFRKNYPDSAFVLVSDNGFDFAHLADYFHLDYTFMLRIGDGVVGMISTSPDPVVAWIERIVDAAKKMDEEFIMVLEEDVRIFKPVKNLGYDMNGVNSDMGLSKAMTSHLKSLGAKIPKRCDDFYHGGCGGCILRTSFLLDHFQDAEKLKQIMRDLKPYQDSADPEWRKWYSSDYWLTVLVLYFGGTVGDYGGFSQTWYLTYRLSKLFGAITVLHYVKFDHNAPLSASDLKILGAEWKDRKEYDEQRMRPVTATITTRKKPLLKRMVPGILRKIRGIRRSILSYSHGT